MNGDKTQTVRAQQTKVPGSDGKTVVIPELYDTEANRSIGIGVGYEMHFAGTDRLVSLCWCSSSISSLVSQL
jgi:hypothetical protein